MVQHVDAADPDIHEPKGVASAADKTVYIADGAGSGTWRQGTFDDFNFTKEDIDVLVDELTQITDGTVEEVDDLTALDGVGLSETTDDSMADIPFATTWNPSQAAQINKNFKELFVKYEEQVEINADMKKNVKELTEKLNAVVQNLRDIGVFGV